MAKIYARLNWENSPSQATPRNAENLNVMDKGIDDLDDLVDALSINKLDKTSLISTDTINDPEKPASSAITFAHGTEIDALNTKLAWVDITADFILRTGLTSQDIMIKKNILNKQLMVRGVFSGIEMASGGSARLGDIAIAGITHPGVIISAIIFTQTGVLKSIATIIIPTNGAVYMVANTSVVITDSIRVATSYA